MSAKLTFPLRLQLRITIRSLRASGWRAAFALAAVAVAIAAVMIMLALQTGARREMDAIADRVGRNLFSVSPARVALPPGRGGREVSSTLRREDAEALRAGVPGIRVVLPVLEGSRPVRFGDRQVTTTVRGVTPDFPATRNFVLADGRLLDERDEALRARTAVAGPFVAARLNEGESLVGETLSIDGIPFEIVGQLQEKGIVDGQNEDDQILIPLETARRRVYNVERLSRLVVQVRDSETMPLVRSASAAVLRERRGLSDGMKNDFEIFSLIRISEVRRVNLALLDGMSRLFAAITLLVGGAGVLAVTWMNASDRTPEIGLRIAMGARSRDIGRQFVLEACLLSVAGGLTGIAIGAAAIAVLKALVGWQMAISIREIALPFAVSVLLGLLFGVVPAWRAARVQPVAALRNL